MRPFRIVDNKPDIGRITQTRVDRMSLESVKDHLCVFGDRADVDRKARFLHNIGSNGDRSSVGRAPGCGPGRRGFESRRLPFFKPSGPSDIGPNIR